MSIWHQIPDNQKYQTIKTIKTIKSIKQKLKATILHWFSNEECSEYKAKVIILWRKSLLPEFFQKLLCL